VANSVHAFRCYIGYWTDNQKTEQMKKKLLSILLLFVASMYMVSCDIDEPISNKTKDPEGTIILSMTLESYSGYIGQLHEVRFWFDDSYNINAYEYSNDIVVVGQVKGISSIKMNNIPSTGWTNKAAAIVGYGYVLRYCYEGHPDNGTAKYHYAALYVDSEILSASGGVLGYIIKALPLNY